MVKNKNEQAGKLSLRRSILVWTAGILIGWGAAFVLIVQLIKTSVSDGQGTSATQIVSKDRKVAMPGTIPADVGDIEPAAGPVTAPIKKKLPTP
jgi:hypothetical protein